MYELDIPSEDILEILLQDGWHRPDPGTLWETVSRVCVLTDRETIDLSNFELIDTQSSCVVWTESTQGSSATVIVKRSAINGVRVRRDAIDEIRVTEFRQYIQHYIDSLDTNPNSMLQIPHYQRLVQLLRDQSPGISADPLDTWTQHS